jgi:hypothetical protein
MSTFVSQHIESVRRGESALALTTVRLSGASDTVELPDLANTSNTVVQLRRPGDIKVDISISDIDTVAITNGQRDKEILLVSLHNDPVPQPR